ncbi:M50 family peptidase, partial [Streptomyces sp. TRM76130]|nr:M50 family peptidase [Streptomyces sp. TRM76130]
MDSTTATSLWDEVTGIQPDPDLWVVIATLVAALVVVVPHRPWRIARNAV